jgi:NAD(P)-dependent dehydrogenase (short-subunit alcohol dehydrogenase family)
MQWTLDRRGNHSRPFGRRALLAAAFMLFATLPRPSPADVAPSPDTAAPTRAVLVTGASTGIGRKVTERLAASGYFVYAGARKQQDLQALGAIRNVQALRLDVTDARDIATAVDTVARAGRGLYGLVNNAGVAVAAPMAELKDEDFDFLMKVNVYGPVRVTKAFLPLLRASKGRIATIGSISGILSAPTLGAYSMSKHAMEAFGDVLAVELAPDGVHSILIEPGNYNSEIGANLEKRMGTPSRLGNRSRYKEPDEVAEAVLLALSEPQPKRRYLVVPDASEGERTIRKAIEELAQLNEDHAHSYDRDSLVKMLDEALAKTRARARP